MRLPRCCRLRALLPALGLALLLAAPPALAETVRVFGSDSYIPYSYLREGKIEGSLPRLLRLLEAETGDRYEIELLPWNRAYKLMEEGLGGIMGLSMTPERVEKLDFSAPVVIDETLLVVLSGKEFAFNSLDDLHGKTLGAGLGSSYGADIDAAIANKLFAVDRDTAPVNRLRKLLGRRFDAAIIGTGRKGVQMLIESDPELKQHAERFAILPRPINSNPLYIAFSKSAKQTVAISRINEGLQKLQKNGKLKNLF